MVSIFLSYSSLDKLVATTVANLLEQEGHDVWWDHHLGGGQYFTNIIEQQIRQSDAVFVLWSCNSVASHWVQDEARLALQLGKLRPVKISQCEIPLGFRSIHAEDWTNTFHDKVTQASVSTQSDVVPKCRCDDLAADPDDYGRVAPGVPSSSLDVPVALSACIHDLRIHPASPRLLYQTGRLFELNGSRVDAERLYRRAVDANYPAALYRLGRILSPKQKENVEGDVLVERAAEQGHAPAIIDIAKALYRTDDLDNAEQACEMLLPLAEANHIDAILALGEIFQHGYGVRKNKFRAYNFYLIAAELDSDEARWQLGGMHERGATPDGILDWDGAMDWYSQAASNGHAWSMFSIGKMYSGHSMFHSTAMHQDYDTSDRINIDQALYWLSMATKSTNDAAAGHALIALGDIFADGELIEPNSQRAVTFWIAAKERGAVQEAQRRFERQL